MGKLFQWTDSSGSPAVLPVGRHPAEKPLEEIVIQVTHGVSSNSFDVASRSVAYVRENLETLYSIPEDAVALLVGGGQVGEDRILKDGDELDFVVEDGRKGVGKVWTDAEMCKLFQVKPEDLDRWESEGCRVMRACDGTRRWTETAIDEFIRGGSVECNEQVLKVLAGIDEKLDQRPLSTAPTKTPAGAAPCPKPALTANLPEEVTTEEAAQILGSSKDTVLKLKENGVLAWRNAAPPSSSRPVFRFSLQSLLKVRTTYDVDTPAPPTPREPQRRQVKGTRKYKHLDLD